MLDPMSSLLLIWALGRNSRGKTPPWPGQSARPPTPPPTPRRTPGGVVFSPPTAARPAPRPQTQRRGPAPGAYRPPTYMRRPAGVPASAKPMPGHPGVYTAPRYKTPSGMKKTAPGKFEMPETYITARQPTLRQGMRGNNVKLVQQKVGAKADGIFGPATKAAVVAFQVQHHLTPDGIVGPKTWAALGY